MGNAGRRARRRASRRVYYNPAAIGQLDRLERPVHAQRRGSPTSATTTSRSRFPSASCGNFFAQRDRAELGRHRRAHGDAAARHRRALHASDVALGLGYGRADHRPLLGRRPGQLRAGDDLAQLAARRCHVQRRHALPALEPTACSIGAEPLELRDRARASTAATCASSTTRTRPATGTTARCPAEQFTDEFPVPGPVPRRASACPCRLERRRAACCSRSTRSTRATTPRA